MGRGIHHEDGPAAEDRRPSGGNDPTVGQTAEENKALTSHSSQPFSPDAVDQPSQSAASHLIHFKQKMILLSANALSLRHCVCLCDDWLVLNTFCNLCQTSAVDHKQTVSAVTSVKSCMNRSTGRGGDDDVIRRSYSSQRKSCF